MKKNPRKFSEVLLKMTRQKGKISIVFDFLVAKFNVCTIYITQAEPQAIGCSNTVKSACD
jgi:hypothetical protein